MEKQEYVCKNSIYIYISYRETKGIYYHLYLNHWKTIWDLMVFNHLAIYRSHGKTFYQWRFIAGKIVYKFATYTMAMFNQRVYHIELQCTLRTVI